MNKTEFQKIMEALDNRLRACSLQLHDLYSTEDLSKLSLARALELKSFCISELDIMTKIIMVDLYHIIGMGNLTPPQMMKFIYAIQKYQSYRPTIKALAKHLDSISELPKLPVDTQYKLQGLGDLTLYSSSSTCEVDDASVEDYNKVKATSFKLPFKIEGHNIKVDLTQFEYFVTLMSSICKSNLSVENFRKKMMQHGEYLGIKWTSYNSYEVSGSFTSADIYTRLSGYYNSHK